MMDVFEQAAGAKPRPWWKQRAIALASVGLALGTMSLTAWGLVTADNAFHRHDTSEAAPVSSGASSASAAIPPGSAPPGSAASVPGVAPGPTVRGAIHGARESKSVRQTKKQLLATHARWERLFGGGVMMVVGFVGLAGFYRFAVEHPAGIRRRAWPGTAAAAGAWLLVSWIFGAYVISLGTYAIYYGSLAAVAVLLVWLYLASLALLFGAEVNALLEGVGAHAHE